MKLTQITKTARQYGHQYYVYIRPQDLETLLEVARRSPAVSTYRVQDFLQGIIERQCREWRDGMPEWEPPSASPETCAR